MVRLAVSMGDPAGIGPEVTVRSLLRMDESSLREVVVVGEAAWLRRVAVAIGGAARSLVFFERGGAVEVDDWPSDIRAKTVLVYNPLPEALPQLVLGRDYAVFGEASFSYVKCGVELVQKGVCQALVTAPIHHPHARTTRNRKYGVILEHRLMFERQLGRLAYS